MSNYTKNTNFTAKDNLTSGDPAKVIKGAEFDTEFNSLQTAVNSKADSNNSQLTGITDAQAVETTGDVTVGGNLSVTGNATIAGNLTFGDADTDTVSFSADVNSNILPNLDATYDLGSATKEWRDLYVDGTAYVDTVNLNGSNITATATELNYTDGVTSNIQTQLNSKAATTTSPTITLAGDLSGNATLTNLGNATLTATVADDSHNHVISNVDGLQTALDSKANLSGANFTGSVDVTGTITADGLIQATRANNECIEVNRTGTDGAIAIFAKDGASVGSIGSGAGTIRLNGTDGTGVYFANSAVFPTGDAAKDLGISGIRFKDLYLSGGVYLGGTGAVNKLDDYEEGTYTPTLTSISGGSATYTSRGSYTKIGNKVTVWFSIQVDTYSHTAGNVAITMPFTNTVVGSTNSAGSVDRNNSSNSNVSCLTFFSTNALAQFTTKGGSYLQANEISVGTLFSGVATYETSA